MENVNKTTNDPEEPKTEEVGVSIDCSNDGKDKVSYILRKDYRITTGGSVTVNKAMPKKWKLLEVVDEKEKNADDLPSTSEDTKQEGRVSKEQLDPVSSSMELEVEEKFSDGGQQQQLQSQEGTGEDSSAEGVTIEGEGKYQIIEVFDDVLPILASTKTLKPVEINILDESEMIFQTEASPLPRPPAVVKKKFPAPALLTKAEERAVALQQMETLKMQQPRRRKQNLAMAVGGQKRDDTIQTEIIVIDSENTITRKRNTLPSDNDSQNQPSTSSGGGPGRSYNCSSNDTDEIEFDSNQPTTSSSKSGGKFYNFLFIT